MLDEHKNIKIFCQKTVMYKVVLETSYDLKLVFLELFWPLLYVFLFCNVFATKFQDWLAETLENKLFLEQSLKLSSVSIMSSSFGWISAAFVFGRLLTVFLSLRYGASHIKKSYFLSPLPVLPHDFLNWILLLFCTLLPFYWTSSSNSKIVFWLHLDKETRCVCIIMIQHVQWNFD